MLIRPTRRQFALGALAAGMLPMIAACGGSDGGLDTETQYSEAVEQTMATYKVPGVLAAVRVAGRPQWARAFGKANVADATPLALNSTFPIRSVTKSFTCTALLQLVREGQLALEDKIGRYIAGVPNGDLITLADLAGMQSGLFDYSQTPGFFAIFAADTLHVWTEQELVAFSEAVQPVDLPGAAYQYSNTNTVLLGMVIETVTGQTLAEALAARVFLPKGLTGTAYPADATLPAPSPTGYEVDLATGAIDDQPPVSPTSLAGSGAMISTLADLLTWGDELGSGSLIGADLQSLRKTRSRAVTNGPEYDNYGLGIGQIGEWWGHTGSGIGYQVATLNLAARNATISVMVNATTSGSRRDLNVAQEVFEALAAVVAAS